VRGWVYVITNKAMPDLVKVGYSTKDPTLRAKELDGTGVPHAFEVVYDALVFDPREVEQRAHKLLAEFREGKEWFRCSVAVSVRAIRDSSETIHQETAYRDVATPEDEITLIEICSQHGCETPPTKAYKGHPFCEAHWLEGRRKRFGGV
jgi:hypothetical protein